MAGDWLKMEHSLPDKPEVLAISSAMQVEPDAVVGKCFRLWRWFDQHTKDGHALGVTSVTLLSVIGHGHGNELFLEQMKKAGWLIENESGLTLPNFDRHIGETAKTRGLATKRKQKERSKVQDDVTDPSRVERDINVTREENRREDIKPSNPNGLDVASHAGDLPGKPEQQAKPDRPECPHQKIIDLYHEVLTTCPQVRDWTPARATQLRARWNEDKKRQDLGWWRNFFGYIAGCDFLVGKTGKEPFYADLEWITKSQNFTKIREGKYENRRAA